MPEGPLVTVVIPSRDRHESLARTVAALRSQQVDVPWELVVVDDGSVPPIDDGILAGLPGGRVLRREGSGPAAARNAGLSAARGRLVLFTDDDTEPRPSWIQGAARFLEDHPGHVAVEGPVISPPFDALHELSLESDAPGAYWTCNMGFRRDALEAVEGFDEGFPYPHCEDLDLAFRVQRVGPIGFAPDMAIVHHPRTMSFAQLSGRGRLTTSEIRLFERHRERYGRVRRLPARLFPLVQSLGFWRYMLRSAGPRPARVARAIALSAAYSLHVVRATLLRRAPAGS